jgi:rfaE bifunctional protein kinase chain/domain
MPKKNILVIGNFDVLHPGHIRLLKFAKECGDHLSVAVNTDQNMHTKSRVNQQHRLEMVQYLQFVDHAFIHDDSTNALIERLKPWAIVKGKEFEQTENSELISLEKYGGKLIFGSGEFIIDAEQLQTQSPKLTSSFNYQGLQGYAQRHNINSQTLAPIFEKIKQVNFAVIGEVIVDEYVQGKAVGLSQEDPTIVMTPTKTNRFLGGAAITAGHIKSLGAKNVTLFSVTGDDEAAQFTYKKVTEYQLSTYLYQDDSRPTPLKRRYRVENKTLLRVNKVRQHKIPKDIESKILQSFKNIIDDVDILVFSDFNYGLLPQSLVDDISALCQKKGVKIVADSQTSSQTGDISRYENTSLITPTEKEVRVALNNTDDGLVILAKKLCDKAKPRNLVITLGREGIFIHIPSEDGSTWENDQIPAINTNAIDPAGAGDCFMAASSLCMAAGASPWQAFYVGSIASACQVSNVGNSPLAHQTLFDTVIASFCVSL